MCAFVAGCSASHRNDLLVGRQGPEDRGPGISPSGDEPAPAPASGRGVTVGGSGAFGADIRNREGVALDVVTIACAGKCFEVVAVARGGYPPYTYRWEDGSTNSVRSLCPDASQAFDVTVTDRGYETDEFKRAAETVTASVSAEVLACPDAGVPDASVPDAMTPPADGGAAGTGGEPGDAWEPLCVPNGSFEDESGLPWRYCAPSDPGARPDITSSAGGFGLPEATHGTRYLRMDPEPGLPVMISVPLCAPVTAGTNYQWAEAWRLGFGSGPVRLEFHFAESECEILSYASQLAPTDTWTRVCSRRWPATASAQWLTIRAIAIGAFGGTVFLDELLATSDVCE